MTVLIVFVAAFILSSECQSFPSIVISNHEFERYNLTDLHLQPRNTTAQVMLGTYYQFYLPHQNYEFAYHYYSLASLQNHSEGHAGLGHLYIEGRYLPQDLYEGIKLIQLSVLQNNARGQNMLGFCAHWGVGIETNLSLSFEMYKLSAIQGYAKGQNNLGNIYFSGLENIVPQDVTLAIYWFQLSAAQEYATAQANLGLAYEYGTGVIQNVTKASEFYQLAANQNSSLGLYRQGLCLWNGVGIEKNRTEALRLWKLAIQYGSQSAVDQVNQLIDVSSSNYKKTVSPSDEELESFLLDQIASDSKQLDGKQRALVQYRLARRYAEGKGTIQNLPLARELYQKSAEGGHGGAMYNLGMFYESGIGGPVDEKEAIKWYKLAAAKQHSLDESLYVNH